MMAKPPNSRPPGKRATREALIQAGLAELAEKGLQAPSLDAICGRAGYTRGAFYVHFEDREDFVAAVMERVLSGFLDWILAAASGEHDLAHPAGRAIQLHRVIEACARSPRIRERWVTLVGEATLRVSKAVSEAQAGDQIRRDVEAEPLAALLISLALGAAAASESGVPFDPARAREAVLALLGAPRAEHRGA
jgi:TetR/AcrR family transcriptional regulator, transcriptional repressor for nem operon